jgi:hypothetical protein
LCICRNSFHNPNECNLLFSWNCFRYIDFILHIQFAHTCSSSFMSVSQNGTC